MSKLTKKDRIKVLEWQVKTLIQSMTNIEGWSDYADEMLTALNHALPDPEYDAKCEAEVADVEASLDRHRERLGLNKPKVSERDTAKELLDVDLSSELTGSDLALELLKNQRYIIASVSDVSDADAIECGNNKLIHKSSEDIFTDDMGDIYCWAVALNNQGEPLTAAEAGF